MTKREAERAVVQLVTEAAGVREERRELTRRLRRIREEVGRLLPLTEKGGGHKKSGPLCLAATGPERDAESVNGGKVARGTTADKTESGGGAYVGVGVGRVVVGRAAAGVAEGCEGRGVCTAQTRQRASAKGEVVK